MSIPQPKVTIAPTFLPVTIRQCKQQLKIPVSVNAHDAELIRMLDTAITTIESDTSWIGAERTYSWSPYLAFPRIDLPFFNVKRVTSVVYIDTDGAQQTLDAAKYTLDDTGVTPQLALTDQLGQWPETDAAAVEPFTVTFEAGFADVASIPPWWRSSVLAMVDAMWMQSGDADNPLGVIYDALTRRQLANYL